jgi:hypothetical protein
MDRLDFYRKCLQDFLRSYSSYGSKNTDIETQLILDPVNDRYLLFRTGWDNQRRIHQALLSLWCKMYKPIQIVEWASI